MGPSEGYYLKWDSAGSGKTVRNYAFEEMHYPASSNLPVFSL